MYGTRRTVQFYFFEIFIMHYMQILNAFIFNATFESKRKTCKITYCICNIQILYVILSHACLCGIDRNALKQCLKKKLKINRYLLVHHCSIKAILSNDVSLRSTLLYTFVPIFKCCKKENNVRC